MTTINAESLLKMLAFSPGQFMMGEAYPKITDFTAVGDLETTQTAWRTVWARNTLYTFATVPEYLYISSSSVLDIGRVIYVYGLDYQYNEIVGYGITNGQTQNIITSLPGAGSPLQFFRVNNCADITPSLSPQNVAAGDIYIAASDPAPLGVPSVTNTRAMIVQGEGRRNGIIFTVPRHKASSASLIIVSQRGDQQIIVRTKVQTALFSGETILYLPEVIINFASLSPGVVILPISPGIAIGPEFTDLTVEARGTSPVSGIISMAFSTVLIDYDYIKNFSYGGGPYPV